MRKLSQGAVIYPPLHSHPETDRLHLKLRNSSSPRESVTVKTLPELTSGSKRSTVAQDSGWGLHTCGGGHPGFWEPQRGCESTVWIRTTAWEHERESAPTPSRDSGCKSGAEDSRVTWRF